MSLFNVSYIQDKVVLVTGASAGIGAVRVERHMALQKWALTVLRPLPGDCCPVRQGSLTFDVLPLC